MLNEAAGRDPEAARNSVDEWRKRQGVGQADPAAGG